MKNLEDRIATIEERNRRVEIDKAWETSLTRRLAIALLTYLVVVGYLMLIDNDKPFINAAVPPLGFLLSTLVIGVLRKIWEQHGNNH